MAYKLTSLGQQPQEERPETYSEFASNYPKRLAAQAVPRLASGLIGIPAGAAAFAGQAAESALKPFITKNEELNALNEKLRAKMKEESGGKEIPFPSVENVYSGASNVLKKLGVSPELFQEKPGFIEGTVNRALTGLPIAYLMPGSFLANATRELGASAGGQAVEELGLGPIPQLIGSLAGGYATGKGINKLSNFFGKGGSIPKLESLANEAEKNLYDQEKILGQKINVPAQGYRSKLNKLYSEIVDDTSLAKSDRSELINKMARYEQDVQNGTLNASKLAERTKQINAAYPKASRLEKTYLKRIQEAMFSEGEEIGKTHPQWHKAWSDARSIGRAKSYQFELPEVLENAPQLLKYLTNGIARAALGITGITAVGQKGLEALAFLKESRAAQQLLKKAAEYTVARNIPALERTYRQINKLADEYEKSLKPSQGRFRIVKA